MSGVVLDDMRQIIELMMQTTDKDPQVMINATQELTKIINNKESSEKFHMLLLEIIIEFQDLSSIFYKIAFLYIKNYLSTQEWSSLNNDYKDKLTSSLFLLLGVSSDSDKMYNKSEYDHVYKKSFIELFGIVFYQKWFHHEWQEEEWSKLVECNAWLCCNKAIKRASALKLRTRIKKLNDIIKLMLPQITSQWHKSLDLLDSNQLPGPLLLTKYFINCLRIGNHSIISNYFDLDTNKWQNFIESCIFKIRYLNTSQISDTVAAHLSYKLSKLLFFLINSVSMNTRSTLILSICQIIMSMFIDSSLNLDLKSSRYLLLIVYKIISVRRVIHSSESNLALTQDAIDKIREFMTKDNSLVTYQYVTVLLRKFLELSQDEVTMYSLHPENCFSAGGVLIADQFSVNCENLFDVDLQDLAISSDSLFSNIKSGSICGNNFALTPRQVAESTLIPMSQNQEFWVVLNRLLRENYDLNIHSVEISFRRESILRTIQMVLKIFHHRSDPKTPGEYQEFFQMAQKIINLEMDQGETLVNEIVNMKTIESFNILQSINLFCYCRALVVMSRFIFYNGSERKNDDKNLLNNCRLFLSKLEKITRVKLNPAHSSDPQLIQVIKSIRLCAVRCLNYLIEHAMFPETAVDTENIYLLLDSSLNLIEDVTECETKVYLLSLLKNTLELVDFSCQKTLADSVLSLLSRLWEKTTNIAMRASILDTISVFLTGLNCSADPMKDTKSLIMSLQNVSIQLITTSLGCDSLFDNCIRLWSAMIKGENAVWPDNMNILCDIACGCMNDGKFNMLDSIDSVSDMYNFIELMTDTLQLVADPSSDSSHENFLLFLTKNTNSFWLQMLLFFSPKNPLEMSKFDQICSDHTQTNSELFKITESAKLREESTPENFLRREIITLLCNWITLLLDNMLTKDQDLGNINVQLMNHFPALFAFITLCTNFTFIPLFNEQSYQNTRFSTTQITLTLLSRMATRQETVLILFHTFFIAGQYEEKRKQVLEQAKKAKLISLDNECEDAIIQKDFNLKANERNLCPSIELSMEIHKYFAQVNSTSFQVDSISKYIEIILEQWLDRTDNCSESVNRRCFGLATLNIFIYIVRNCTKSLDDQRNLHNQWMERIISLCIQCLVTEDRVGYSFVSKRDLINSYPKQSIDLKTLREEISKLLQIWEQSFTDGAKFAQNLFNESVDPALRLQLNQLLTCE